MSSFKEKLLVSGKLKKLLNLKLINTVIAASVAATFGFYLFGVNSLSIKGFELSEINKKVNDLNTENAELELKTMQLESYAYINEKIKNLGLVKADKIDYITPQMGVAKR
ncbi:MAG: hypothetical protein WCW77_04945 [Patescibacteria group bacterium]|jgi:hypothetical protein